MNPALAAEVYDLLCDPTAGSPAERRQRAERRARPHDLDELVAQAAQARRDERGLA